MSDASSDVRPSRSFARSFVNGLRLRLRLLFAVGAALVCGWFLPSAWSASLRLAVTWNVGCVVYLGMAIALMGTCSTERIKERAAREDEAQIVFFALILCAVVSSFYAVFGLIADAKALAGAPRIASIALAATTIFMSWLVMQVVFTLHYAHEYYGSSDAGDIRGGLTFPSDPDPDYWDFFYFTTSIGATSQTSDVAITSKFIRRMVSFQAVLSFVFNTTVVALAINLASGLVAP